MEKVHLMLVTTLLVILQIIQTGKCLINTSLVLSSDVSITICLTQ